MNTPLSAPWRFALLLAVGVTANTTTGADLLPADRPVPDVIDHHVDLQLQKAKVAPAPQADDATFVRRLYLDLAGRIPTPAEAREYIDSTDPKKREKLVAELVASPEFIRHNANEFDAFLRNDNGDGGSVRPYLIAAFKENRSWDRMFRDLLGAAEAPHPAKPEQYVLRRLKDRDALTRDVSSVFFGLNISCAQCHNHPYIESLTQDYFFGMREFFAASYDFQGNLLDRRLVKPAEFKPKTGAARPAKLLFLNGQTVEREGEPAADLAKAIQEESKAIEQLGKAYAKDKVLPPQAKFRAREKLADLALKPENRDLFARAMVNRLWYRFYGYGLVMRVDQMHANNPASHPELLDWLTRDFVAHGYDLKRLIAGLVSAKAYARSSEWKGTPVPALELFAVASVRPLTPAQWATSFQLANNPAQIGRDKTFEAREKALIALETAAKPLENLIQYPRDDMPIPVTESMRLSNDLGLNKTIGAQLLPTLKKATDRKAQITEAVWAVLSRPQSADEYELFESYLERRKERPDAALQQLVWALLNSPEFRFNH
ncbi:MAG: DUF1549 domain-containing protein [Gemmata sp.]